jgi:pyruvate-formate lyase-activating enzyme
MSSLLNVASLHHDLHTVHPSPRASILHLQGCLKGRTDPCPGCANQDLWSDEGRRVVDPLDLASGMISGAASPALSISGGEPLDQYEPLCTFLEALYRARFSLLIWTGF